MSNKSVVPVWVSALMAILCVGAIACDVVSMISGYSKVLVVILDLLAYISIFYYCVEGYKKSSAAYFRIFCAMYLIASACGFYFRTVGLASGAVAAIEFLLSLVIFGTLFLLTVAKDVGKKRSMTLSALIIASNLAIALLEWLLNSVAILSVLGAVLISVVFFLLIYAKYKDKAARGAK